MSILGALDMFSTAMQLGAQHQEAENNRAFQAEQAEIQRGFAHEEAQLAYERELQADSTKYQRQVQDLTRAGLNPMLAVQQSAGSVHSSPASSSLPAGAQAHLGGVDFLAAVRLDMERKLNDAQVANINANTDKTKAETEGQENVNRLFRNTEDLRAALLGDQHERNQWEKEIGLRGVQVKEDNQRMLESNAQHYNDYLDKQADYVHELKVSEDFKREMYRANARESRQNAAYKAAMLEVDKQAREASTEESREQANLLATEARIKNGIYNEDYIRAICREANAEAELKEILAEYKKGDYHRASVRLQKVLKELERKGQIMPIGEAFGESTRAAAALPGLN